MYIYIYTYTNRESVREADSETVPGRISIATQAKIKHIYTTVRKIINNLFKMAFLGLTGTYSANLK